MRYHGAQAAPHSHRARQQGGYPGQGYTPGYHGQAPTMNFQAHHVQNLGSDGKLGEPLVE